MKYTKLVVDILRHLDYYSVMAKFNHLKLNGILAESGRKQTEAAVLMGVHINTISNWVNGKAEPRPTQLIDLLIGLGCEVDNIRLVEFWQPNGYDAT